MATVDTDGECVCTAGALLDRLASQLVGGLGLQETRNLLRPFGEWNGQHQPGLACPAGLEMVPKF